MGQTSSTEFDDPVKHEPKLDDSGSDITFLKNRETKSIAKQLRETRKSKIRSENNKISKDKRISNGTKIEDDYEELSYEEFPEGRWVYRGISENKNKKKKQNLDIAAETVNRKKYSFTYKYPAPITYTKKTKANQLRRKSSEMKKTKVETLFSPKTKKSTHKKAGSDREINNVENDSGKISDLQQNIEESAEHISVSNKVSENGDFEKEKRQLKPKNSSPNHVNEIFRRLDKRSYESSSKSVSEKPISKPEKNIQKLDYFHLKLVDINPCKPDCYCCKSSAKNRRIKTAKEISTEDVRMVKQNYCKAKYCSKCERNMKEEDMDNFNEVYVMKKPHPAKYSTLPYQTGPNFSLLMSELQNKQAEKDNYCSKCRTPIPRNYKYPRIPKSNIENYKSSKLNNKGLDGYHCRGCKISCKKNQENNNVELSQENNNVELSQESIFCQCKVKSCMRNTEEMNRNNNPRYEKRQNNRVQLLKKSFDKNVNAVYCQCCCDNNKGAYQKKEREDRFYENCSKRPSTPCRQGKYVKCSERNPRMYNKSYEQNDCPSPDKCVLKYVQLHDNILNNVDQKGRPSTSNDSRERSSRRFSSKKIIPQSKNSKETINRSKIYGKHDKNKSRISSNIEYNLLAPIIEDLGEDDTDERNYIDCNRRTCKYISKYNKSRERQRMTEEEPSYSTIEKIELHDVSDEEIPSKENIEKSKSKANSKMSYYVHPSESESSRESKESKKSVPSNENNGSNEENDQSRQLTKSKIYYYRHPSMDESQQSVNNRDMFLQKPSNRNHDELEELVSEISLKDLKSSKVQKYKR